MEIRQLRSFVAVAETRSVTRAAELMHLVQPAVTRQIRALEQELGVSLFERNRRGMLLTASGQAMLLHARRVLQQIERAKAEVQPESGGITGLVTVGLLPSTAEMLTIPLLERIKDSHPGIKIRVRVGFSRDLQQDLDREDIDVALLYETQNSPTMNVQPLLEEELWAVAPAGATFPSADSLDMAYLAEQRLVLPSAGQGMRTVIDSAGAQTRQEIIPDVETDSMDVQKLLVTGAGYWTILPAGCLARELAEGQVQALPVSDAQLRRVIIMATSRDSRSREAVAYVAQQLHALGQDLVASGQWLAAHLPH